MEIKNHGADVSQVAKSQTQTTESNGKSVSEVASNKTAYASSKQLMNSAIISAQQEVSLSSGNEPMILLYRAAIEAINEELAPTMGDNALQTAYDNGVDTSPDATADRIVSFATNFFSLYQDQNSSMSFDEQLSSFMEIIGGAIDQGFDEAKEILTGLEVLEGDIASGVEQTYSLIQEGLLAFKDSFSSDDSEAS
ncbi:hypothetical protein GCM10007978_28170 [Shewanella hanedai]|uniref:DUF5610 domain-containing protein n=1 Tax=Shewanella hanedai TaxID=25 RepID=A0A553JLF4_SHEHA|nr:DUF5610 domain-containing protein [Shewanella hanedai]TRY13279.1 hypothetical protein FN961_16665 [Shewanella hanedai]GGI88882.1 hypothetical protein GCM10007978_28170 [Shewanella hanedai]